MTLAELLVLPAPRFVESLYTVLLGRDPDPVGREFYRQRLLAGVSKVQLVREVVNSPEGLAMGPVLEHYRDALVERRSLLSKVRTPLYRALRLPGSSAFDEAKRNSVQARMEEVEEAVASNARDLARLSRLIEQRAANRTRESVEPDGQVRVLLSVVARLDLEVEELRRSVGSLSRQTSKAQGHPTPLESLEIAARRRHG